MILVSLFLFASANRLWRQAGVLCEDFPALRFVWLRFGIGFACGIGSRFAGSCLWFSRIGRGFATVCRWFAGSVLGGFVCCWRMRFAGAFLVFAAFVFAPV